MKPNEILSVNISRENDTKKVWYEWNFRIAYYGELSNDDKNKKECSYGIIHNMGGANASILL